MADFAFAKQSKLQTFSFIGSIKSEKKDLIQQGQARTDVRASGTFAPEGFIVKSKEEGLDLLKSTFKGIGDETGKNASKFGYRVDEVAEEAVEKGLKQGHTGTHINYYNNGVKGTIVIEP